MAVNSTPRTFQAAKNVGAVEFTALSGRIRREVVGEAGAI